MQLEASLCDVKVAKKAGGLLEGGEGQGRLRSANHLTSFLR